jgi:hypothetical protein
MADQPKTLAEFIDAIRAGLICGVCGKYVGGLAPRRFLPAPYPVALGKIGAEDEAEVLIGFEWYLLGLMRAGTFVVKHPQLGGECVSFREWAARDDEAEEPA